MMEAATARAGSGMACRLLGPLGTWMGCPCRRHRSKHQNSTAHPARYLLAHTQSRHIAQSTGPKGRGVAFES